MNQGLVEFTAEGVLRDFDSLRAIHIELHVLSPLNHGLDSGTHDHVTTGAPGDGTLDQQQVALGVYTHDFQRLNGYTLRTQVTGHFLALEHSTRSLALADGTRCTVGNGVTVGVVLTTEVPALDGTGVALTFGLTSDINHLTGFEQGYGNFVTCLVLTVFQAEFEDATTSSNAGLGEVTGLRLGHAGSTTLAHGYLNGAIAIGFFALELGYAIRLDLNDRDRNGNAFFGENAGHTAFTTD